MRAYGSYEAIALMVVAGAYGVLWMQASGATMDAMKRASHELIENVTRMCLCIPLDDLGQ